MMAICNDRLLDAVQETTRQHLIESYYISKGFGNDPKMVKSLKRVIRYCSDPGQWVEFQKEIENGNS